jgi:sugar phosphate isomerase/epimerase
MKIGVLLTLEEAKNRIGAAVEMGIHSCQLCSWNLSVQTDEMAAEILSLLEKYDMQVSSFWAGWSGPQAWNFTEGPVTLGLLPAAYRYRRVQELKSAADFAKKLGIKQIVTHAGFIPENPHDPQYAGLIDALRDVAEHLKKNGQYLLFETGQETPVTLLRCFEQVGTDNLGVNLDTANLILYGKANPVDALDVFGKYVRNTHIKDGLFPDAEGDGMQLGKETPVGEGLADIPTVLKMLKDLGYEVEERLISIDELIAAIEAGKLEEAWGTGTAAVVSPIGKLTFEGKEYTVGNGGIGEVTGKLYSELTGIQWGRIEDTRDWIVSVC